MKLFVIALPCVLAFLIQSVASEVLGKLFENAIPCENRCSEVFSVRTDLICSSCCQRGCRFFTMIDLAKESQNVNVTTEACFSACIESYINTTFSYSCFEGCKYQALSAHKHEEGKQTLHLLTPLLYIKSAYDLLVDHVRHFITTSWTVYLQQDTGKVVLTRSEPQIIQETKSDFADHQLQNNPTKVPSSSWNYHSRWDDRRPSGWMDCISHQSGLPRWLLVAVLFGFVVALVWLCCATAVTAPQHYVNSSNSKKSPLSQDTKFILVCEPSDKVPLLDEAPPLPLKSEIQV